MTGVFRRRGWWCIALGVTYAAAAIAQVGTTNGTIAYKSRAGEFNAALKYGWLISGPDSVNPGKTVRRLIFSTKDIGPAIQACATIMCADGQLTEGMTIDFDVGPRLNYWITLNGQKVQYSGTVVPTAFAATANDAQQLAGKIAIDDVAAGGPKIDVEFDVKRSKEFKK